MWGLYSQFREYGKIFSRNLFRNLYSHDIVAVFTHPWWQYKTIFLGGINFAANTCGACIRTQANTGKYAWRIIYVLVSCQEGYVSSRSSFCSPQKAHKCFNMFSF